VKLAWNIAAGVANVAWTAVVGFVAVPFYLRYLGIEAYGLIGFFMTLQALLVLLDLGLTPTINREVARSTQREDLTEIRDLLHTLALVYAGIAGLIAVLVVAGAPLLGRYWLSAGGISVATLTRSIALMGLVVAVRLPVGLYAGVLLGAGRMVWASAIEMLAVTLSNLGAVAVLAAASRSIEAFFIWQLFAAIATLAAMRAAAWRVLAAPAGARRPQFDRTGLRRILKFSAGMGATALLGTVFMQSDKIILSKIVSLQDLGRYTLASAAARILYVFLTPTFAAVYPRISAWHAAGREDEIVSLYKNGTRLLTAVVFSVAIFLAVFAVEIIGAWTGDMGLAAQVRPVFAFLLLGTALNGVMHFPYALQLGYGKSWLPVAINGALLVVYVPLVVVLTKSFGIVGGAAAWAALNALYVLLGVWMTHRRILPGVGLGWLLGDVGLPVVVAAVVVGAGGYWVERFGVDDYVRIALGGLLAGVSVMIIVALTPGLSRTAVRLLRVGAAQALGRPVSR
jgi:O-antigen/teichoic acid export membrane protein